MSPLGMVDTPRLHAKEGSHGFQSVPDLCQTLPTVLRVDGSTIKRHADGGVTGLLKWAEELSPRWTGDPDRGRFPPILTPVENLQHRQGGADDPQ